MAMDPMVLKTKIIEVMTEIRTEENNPEQSMDRFAEALAIAIVNEVKKITIVATAPNGAVTIVSVN
ncbi:hypothetical protein ACK2M7_12605 [Chryseobacterium sp. TY4]